MSNTNHVHRSSKARAARLAKARRKAAEDGDSLGEPYTVSFGEAGPLGISLGADRSLPGQAVVIAFSRTRQGQVHHGPGVTYPVVNIHVSNKLLLI